MISFFSISFFFFFNDTATTEIYTLSLHDALPILRPRDHERRRPVVHPLHLGVDGPAERRGPYYRRLCGVGGDHLRLGIRLDRKSTRLNSSHTVISYAVFCLKKKIHIEQTIQSTQF